VPLSLRPVVEKRGPSLGFLLSHEEMMDLMGEIATRAGIENHCQHEYGDLGVVWIQDGRRFLDFIGGGPPAIRTHGCGWPLAMRRSQTKLICPIEAPPTDVQKLGFLVIANIRRFELRSVSSILETRMKPTAFQVHRWWLVRAALVLVATGLADGAVACFAQRPILYSLSVCVPRATQMM
jgi:hypothetical protein